MFILDASCSLYIFLLREKNSALFDTSSKRYGSISLLLAIFSRFLDSQWDHKTNYLELTLTWDQYKFQFCVDLINSQSFCAIWHLIPSVCFWLFSVEFLGSQWDHKIKLFWQWDHKIITNFNEIFTVNLFVIRHWWHTESRWAIPFCYTSTNSATKTSKCYWFTTILHHSWHPRWSTTLRFSLCWRFFSLIYYLSLHSFQIFNTYLVKTQIYNDTFAAVHDP